MQAKHALIPYVPMLVPPKKWKGYDIDRISDLNVEVFLRKTCYWVCLCGCKANMVKFSIPSEIETIIDL